jgi:hypothetical protein
MVCGAGEARHHCAFRGNGTPLGPPLRALHTCIIPNHTTCPLAAARDQQSIHSTLNTEPRPYIRLAWDQGVNDIKVLQDQAFAAAIASQICLPMNKHNKLVEALVSSRVPPPSNGGEASLAAAENKFEAHTLFMCHGSMTALGIVNALGILPEELPNLLNKANNRFVFA